MATKPFKKVKLSAKQRRERDVKAAVDRVHNAYGEVFTKVEELQNENKKLSDSNECLLTFITALFDGRVTANVLHDSTLEMWAPKLNWDTINQMVLLARENERRRIG